MGTDVHDPSRRSAAAVAALCVALLALILAAGCGAGKKDAKVPPTSGSIMAAASEYTGGVNPSLAATADGWVVEFHESAGRDHIWCNVGRFADDGSFAWLGEPDDRGTGVEPGVAMTDDGLIVAVHRARNGNGLWYEVGRLDKNEGKITWLHEAVDYDSGSYPRVVVFNNGWVLETHRSTVGSQRWYKVGKINSEDNTIDFGGARELEGKDWIAAFKDTDSGQFVQLMNEGYRFGSIDKQNRAISWIGSWQDDPGVNRLTRYDMVEVFGDVSVYAYRASDNRYWVVYVAKGEGDNEEILFMGRGKTQEMGPQARLDSLSLQNIGSGNQPAFADSNGRAIEMHGAGIMKTLWYSTGSY